jgi:hypothetical protein
MRGRGGMQPPEGRGEGTPAPGTQTPGPDSGTKTGDKRGASSPVPGESASPKKSRGNVDVPFKKALRLKKPRSYHMNKKEIAKEERPTKARAVSFLYFSKSYFFSVVLACHRNPHPCAVDVTIPGSVTAEARR